MTAPVRAKCSPNTAQLIGSSSMRARTFRSLSHAFMPDRTVTGVSMRADVQGHAGRGLPDQQSAPGEDARAVRPGSQLAHHHRHGGDRGALSQVFYLGVSWSWVCTFPGTPAPITQGAGQTAPGSTVPSCRLCIGGACPGSPPHLQHQAEGLSPEHHACSTVVAGPCSRFPSPGFGTCRLSHARNTVRERLRVSVCGGGAQIYNQIYNSTYSAFNDGRNLTQLPPTALNYSSPVLSSAVLPTIAYNTEYFYQVSDANGVFTGEVFSFISAPGAFLLLSIATPSFAQHGHVLCSTLPLPGHCCLKVACCMNTRCNAHAPGLGNY